MRKDLDLLDSPIPGLVLRIAWPVSVGFFFHTMFNVADTWFAGRISTQAQAALTLSFPVFFIIIATGSGFATGATALIGSALGAGNRDAAREYTLQALGFAVIASVLLCAAGQLAAAPLFRLLGAEGEYLAISLAYIRPLFWAAPAFLLLYMSNAVLNALGRTAPLRNFLMAGCLANLVLDPWFIFGGLGLPGMGVAGIAWATALLQALGAAYIHLQARATGLATPRSLGELIPRPGPMRDILVQGLPATLNSMTIALGIFVITWFVGRYGPAPVAAYGIAVRAEQIVLLPSIGLNTAVLSLAAQNFGAGNYDRIRATLRTCLVHGGWIMALGGVAVYTLAGPLMRLFTDDPAVIAPGTDYLHVAALTLFSYIILFTHTAALQGMRRPMFAIVIGVLRQAAAPVVVFWLLSEYLGLGLGGIWWGIFCVNWSAAVVALGFARWRIAADEARGRRPAPKSRP